MEWYFINRCLSYFSYFFIHVPNTTYYDKNQSYYWLLYKLPILIVYQSITFYKPAHNPPIYSATNAWTTPPSLFVLQSESAKCLAKKTLCGFQISSTTLKSINRSKGPKHHNFNCGFQHMYHGFHYAGQSRIMLDPFSFTINIGNCVCLLRYTAWLGSPSHKELPLAPIEIREW